jgi:hypothetical protein
VVVRQLFHGVIHKAPPAVERLTKSTNIVEELEIVVIFEGIVECPEKILQ